MHRMLGPTIVMALLAAALLLAGFLKGTGEHVAGTKAGIAMAVQVLPLLLLAFLVAGMVQVLVPSDVVAKWIGPESGLKGVWIGAVAGALTPGGPYVSFPIAAGFLKSGAGAGTIVAFLAAWALWSLPRLPLEVGILGWRITGIRLACTCFLPPLAGWLAQGLTRSTS